MPNAKQEAAAARLAASTQKAQESRDVQNAAMLAAITPPAPVEPAEPVEPQPLSEREQVIQDYHDGLRASGQLQYVRQGQLPTATPYVQQAYVRKPK